MEEAKLKTPGPDEDASVRTAGATIARAAGIVMTAFLLSKGLGLVREMVISARFGTSSDLDAYIAAFRLPDMVFQLIAGGALASAFIPTVSTYLTQGDDESAWDLFSAIATWVLLLGITAATIGMLLALPLVKYLIAPGFSPAQQRLTAHLMRWMFISSVIFGVSGLVMANLNARQHFLFPALAPSVYNLGIIIGAWLLAPSYGVFGLVMGVVGGAFGHLLIQLPQMWKVGARYRLRLGIGDPGVREVLRLVTPRILGISAVQVNFLVNTILASGLVAGSLAALNYAWILMLLPLGLFSQAVGTATFPTFAEQVARGDSDAMNATLGAILRAVFFLTIPTSVILVILRVPLVALILQRGHFTAHSTEAVAYALQFYALGLFAHSGVEILDRAFYAMHDTMTPVMIGVGAMAINVLMSLWLVHPMGHGGLALANTVATFGEVSALLWLMRRRLRMHAAWGLVPSLAKSITASAVVAVALWAMLQTHALLMWQAAVAGTAIGVVLYFLAAAILRARELQMLRSLVARR